MRARLMLLTLVALALPRPAGAWHNEGHMAVARVAWQQLDDGQRKRAFQILQSHPHKDAFLAVDRPAEVPEPVWFFVKAATWPDWVRDPHGPGLSAQKRAEIKKDFNKRDWHFVNLPFVHPDETGQFDAAAIRKQILEPETDDHGEPRHALAALKQALQRLQDAQTSEADKAVSLCWLLHLAGDLHQPLHASALIGSKDQFGPEQFDPPHGDEGANRCAIKVNKDDPDALELHSFWDGLLFSDRPKFPKVEAIVLGWLQDPKLQLDQFPELAQTEFLAWAEESLALAKASAYQDGGTFLKFKPLRPKHTPEDLKNSDAPALSETYKQNAADVARKRMVLAGYRLADRLKPVLAPPP
jgi:hypothetical protein